MEKKHNNKTYVWIFGIFIICILAFTLITSFRDFETNTIGSFDSMSEYQGKTRSNYLSDNNFAPDINERKIVKNANINLKSDNYDDSKFKIKNSITAHTGIILRENEETDTDNYRYTYYTIKLDSTKVDIFLDEIKTYGEVNNFNVYSDDLTGTSIDYSQRLSRLNSQIIKYELILNKNSITISEEININNRINTLENEIYNLQKNINNIDVNVKYSDIKITLNEKRSFLSEIDFLGISDGLKLFLNSLKFGLQFFLSLIGFILPFLSVYLIYKFFKRKSINY